ncbi:uncharacterized protein BDV17DRAFT_281831 [Aspergillus undulatus]|uniref:uncharacterized protein n=1 Tax=Aspergillus undulatus TaxID=1810928 RepID=UPI003CCDD535
MSVYCPPGQDTWFVINSGIAFAGLLSSLRSACSSMYWHVESTCFSEVPLYHDIIKWLEYHVPVRRNVRSVLSVTNTQAYSNSNSPHTADLLSQFAAGKFNARSQASSPISSNTDVIQLKLFNGSRFFCFKGWCIFFTHSLQTMAMADPLLFLEEARSYNLKISKSSISVYHAIGNAWELVRWRYITTRPSRSISTVIPDNKKDAYSVIWRDYLRPDTRKWYSGLGIPYRRTSLASAIAGVFERDIYVLSLMDPQMTKPQFSLLFSEFPARGQNPPADSGAVSLSALLNAIDKVCSLEARVHNQRTARPGPRLIHPGRVVMHAQFDLPSQAEFRGLFRSSEDEEQSNQTEILGLELYALAQSFPEKLPEHGLGLAEVHGFLLQYKQQPQEACARAAEWIKANLWFLQ